jgi:hypothetical protein
MISLSRLFNAFAPGSARLFSAAAASGENSFKVGTMHVGDNSCWLTRFQLNKKDSTVTWTLSPVKYHLLTEKMPTEVTTTRDEAMKYFTEMSLMRRMELVADMYVAASDTLFKEAVLSVSGCTKDKPFEASATCMMARKPSPQAWKRCCPRKTTSSLPTVIIALSLAEVTPSSVFLLSLLAVQLAVPRAKAALCTCAGFLLAHLVLFLNSLDRYLRSANFFGGNGIVGAQCAVGTGLALAAKYHEHGNMKIGPVPCKHVSVTMFGDGASNQVSVFCIAMLRLTTFIFRDNYMSL